MKNRKWTNKQKLEIVHSLANKQHIFPLCNLGMCLIAVIQDLLFQLLCP